MIFEVRRVACCYKPAESAEPSVTAIAQKTLFIA
jgi:hypothetical protein